MSEKQTTQSKETAHINAEQLEVVADRQREAARDALDQAEKAHKERQSEHEALAEAKKIAHESDVEKQDQRPSIPAERRRGVISKKQLSHAYDLQLDHAREHMSPVSKGFSKLIHNRAIETASETIGSTIARPNALLSGSIAAFIAITVLYFVAKHYGYQLSGFETIGAFIAGWVFGILFDYFSVMIRGRRD